MDHMPIITVLDIEPVCLVQADKYNFKLMDWEKFRKTLKIRLDNLQVVEELTTVEAFHNQITNLDTAIKEAIKEHIQVMKMSLYMKRWWSNELTDLKKQKEHLARKSYRKRACDEDPIHEKFRQAQNKYSEVI